MPVDYSEIKALATVLRIIQSCQDPLINDVTEEGDGSLILTVDHGNSYELVRLDVSSLGEDPLEHDQ